MKPYEKLLNTYRDLLPSPIDSHLLKQCGIKALQIIPLTTVLAQFKYCVINKNEVAPEIYDMIRSYIVTITDNEIVKFMEDNK